ncbi:hypothetical protein [Streptomyces sp. NPDC004267]|uniref:hypothetical protein n=1 Tax=Streptomyces sp. NPDC004267 TaxID=3364694 RepID=UPI003687D43E
MTDTPATAVASLLAAASPQGPGDTLRIVLLVSMVGGALLAWFLVRGYRKGAEDTAPQAGAGARAGERAEGRSEAAAARTENGPGDANA